MTVQDDPEVIRWRLHLRSAPATVHGFLATREGRERFWGESAAETDGTIEFRFFSGEAWRSRILENSPPRRFAVEYFQGSRVVFDLADDGAGGTELTLAESGVPESDRPQHLAGWVSVLLSLKAAVGFGVDLRNRERERSWGRGYVDV